LPIRQELKQKPPGITMADRRISEAMMSMWAQFARTGNPSIDGLIDWPSYNASTDRYLYIADPLQVKSGFSKIVPEQAT
jgi:para-nitrobenzyl esterase